MINNFLAMQSVYIYLDGECSNLPQEFGMNENFWIRPFRQSLTNIFPYVSKARAHGNRSWSDAEPPSLEHPTKHRTPFGPDRTIRLLF